MKKFLTLIFILFVIVANGQDNPLLDQYLGNKYLINPAYGGSLEQTIIRTNFRQQWQGFEGAPKVNSISFHTRLFDGRRSQLYSKVGHGIGATLYNEKEGPVSLFGVSGSYAYHMPFDKFQLAVGLNLSASNYSISSSELLYGFAGDEAAISEDNSVFIPDADIGVYLYDTKERFFLGFTGAQLVRSMITLNASTDSLDLHNGMGRQFILMGGVRAVDNQQFILETSLVGIFRDEFMPENEVHINAKASVVNYLNRYNDEVLSFILSYRTKRAFVAQVELSMANIFLAYAYEHSFSQISAYTTGTHNVTLGINIDKYRR